MARTRPLKVPTKRQEKMVVDHGEAMEKEAEVEDQEAKEEVVIEAIEEIGEIEETEDLTPPSPRTMMKITISKLLEIKTREGEIVEEVEEEEIEEMIEDMKEEEIEAERIEIEAMVAAEEAEEIEVIADSEIEVVIDHRIKMKMLMTKQDQASSQLPLPNEHRRKTGSFCSQSTVEFPCSQIQTYLLKSFKVKT